MEIGLVSSDHVATRIKLLQECASNLLLHIRLKKDHCKQENGDCNDLIDLCNRLIAVGLTKTTVRDLHFFDACSTIRSCLVVRAVNLVCGRKQQGRSGQFTHMP